MLKYVKTIIITIIISLFTCNYVYALDVNMNTNSATSNNTAYTQTDYLSSTANNDYSVSLSSMPESELGFNTILNIILVVIGILLILLGIAILIRLKK